MLYLTFGKGGLAPQFKIFLSSREEWNQEFKIFLDKICILIYHFKIAICLSA